MKWYHVLSLALAVALAGCNLSAVIGGAGHAPAKASVAGARGLFLQAGAAKGMSRERSMSGRDIVTATAATLGVISASGVPQTADFTDATGATVTVEITQAMQLTSRYVLFSYTYAGGAGTATLDMTTGALASVSQVPDNWPMIYATAGAAYYESAGGIWSADLAMGACVELSTGGNEYAGGGVPVAYNLPWEASTAWIHADASGNVYVLDHTGTGYFMAEAFTSSGMVDFGNSNQAYNLWKDLPLGMGGFSHNWLSVDASTGAVYLLEDISVYGVDPNAPPGAAIAVYPVTFDPSAAGVISIAGTPVMQSTISNGVFGTTYVGFQYFSQSSVWTNGGQSWTLSGSALTAYDTSAVPSVNNGAGAISNWSWSGGQVYAGPATAQSVSLVNLGVGTATALVTDAQTIISWSVVGGVLFYTDATGTYQAAVDTVTATAAKPTLYTGGQVVGVTQ